MSDDKKPAPSSKGTAPTAPDLSSIKNKVLRQELYRKQKHEKNIEKIAERKKRKHEAAASGEPLERKQKTLDNMRVKDATVVERDDEEVMQDEASDEFSAYFKCESAAAPKVLITTCNRPKASDTLQFVKDLVAMVPNAEYRPRKGIDLKKIIPEARARGFTDLVVVNEDQQKANGLVISHLPDGPTAHFKLSSVMRGWKIKGHGRASSHRPEIVLNNFNTRLGHSVARLLAALFPYDPQFVGRRAVTFHNQRDFIFFRHHRYIFKNAKKTGLQELGPRFTLKLRSLQKGTFNTKFGEFEWIHKRKAMDTSRRKFHL